MFYAGLLPEHYDFVIAQPRVTGEDSASVAFEEACIAAGRFDNGWRYREAFAVRGKPGRRAAAPCEELPGT